MNYLNKQFEVVPLREGALKGASPEAVATFWRQYEDAEHRASKLNTSLGNALKKAHAMGKALGHSTAPTGELDQQLYDLKMNLMKLDASVFGNRSKQEPGQMDTPTIGDRLFAIFRGVNNSTYGPTETAKRGMELVESHLDKNEKQLSNYLTQMDSLLKEMVKSGAPWVEGEMGY